MARPKKDREHKLSKTVVFRLTEGELQKLEHWSVMCGQHLAVMIRQKLFTGKYPKTVLPKVTVDLYAELNRIGVNINQLTKQVNAGRLPISLRAVLDAVEKQQQEIIRHLLDDRG
ncbi:plasmid mobilization relaxosome protein MobC [Mucilaginibacter rigui]|uniref:Plasmid mobilization relaxosome protein MobC n=1 Tax=Mucilaginibacter rigui TaxID=534635 RepID=A0ABR7X4A9_9SPHI|nr:plasmid mobilization relaxosome protein MobC [Mucilaginibacter rigui]MBD1385420.1 plasmid mobilization relaxosome protein MobC [Mucilaginibacter rigui]